MFSRRRWAAPTGRSHRLRLDAAAAAALAEPLEDRRLLAAQLVADINQDSPGTTPIGVTALPGTGRALFERAGGTELWSTDGTLAGTSKVTDLPNGGVPIQLRDEGLVPLGNGAACFFGYSPTDRPNDPTEETYALYRTDGTAAGTQVLVDRLPTRPGLHWQDGQVLYFFGTDPATNQFSLFKSDGTAAGTTAVPVSGGPAAGGRSAVVSRGALVYLASLPDGNVEVRRGDGTAAGTRPLGGSFRPTPDTFADTSWWMTDVGGTVYFRAYSRNFSGIQYGRLVTCDGTNAPVALGEVDAAAGDFAGYNGALYFRNRDRLSDNDWELWRTDGTAAGTAKFKNLRATGNAYPNHLAAVGGYLYFAANEDDTRSGPAYGTQIWRSDGTPAGTILLKQFSSSFASADPATWYAAAGGQVFFASHQHLHRTDGTPAGTGDIHPANLKSIASEPNLTGPFTALGGRLLFISDGQGGRELWLSDGTLPGTAPLDLSPKNNDGRPGSFAELNGAVYFQAYGNFASPFAENFALMKTDGTAAGTTVVTSGASVVLGPMTRSGDALYFNGAGELWKTDGTAAGTGLVKDIDTFTTRGSQPRGLTDLDGTLLFVAEENGDVQNPNLWRSDGTTAGTVKVRDDVAVSGPSPYGRGQYAVTMLRAGQNVFFPGKQQATGEELWRSDGTAAGTALVADTEPGPASKTISLLAAAGGRAFYARGDGVFFSPRFLWASDGTAAGTNLLTEVAVPSDAKVVAARDVAYFAAGTPGTPQGGLWRSDGTPGGTALVRAFDQAVVPMGATASGLLLFYVGNAAGGAHQLWATDGTPAGTTLVREFQGMYPTATTEPVVFAGKLFFPAQAAGDSLALWISDGTPAGTRRAYAGDEPGNVTPRGEDDLWAGSNMLLFVPDHPRIGREAWRWVPDLPAPRAGGPYVAAEGQSFVLSAAGTPDPDGAVVRYEWDFDYDGVTFGADATGSSVTLTAPDGPAARTVAVRAVGAAAGATGPVTTATLTVTNVAPAATFTNSGPVTAGSPATVSFSDAADVPADLSAGLRYSFDFDNDGNFEVAGAASPTATVPAPYLAAAGTRTVRGRVSDKDGGFTDYTTAITVWPAPTQITLSAIADAYVRDGTSAATNFGSATQLQVKASGGAGSTRESYLRFDLTNVGTVTSAVLRLFGNLSADGENVTVGAYPVADVSWGEGTINWNNKPAAGAGPVATATLLGTVAKWYEWDLTDYLKQQKAAGASAVTLVLRGAAISAAVATFDSDESATAANRPQLLVQSQAADTTAPALAGLGAAGSAWSSAFRAYLASAGLSDGSGGFNLPLAVAAASPNVPLLPWTNLDRFALRFSEAVDVQRGDLVIAGARAAGYAIKSFSYDPPTFTATWTLAAPLAKPDRLRLSIAAGAVADLAGNPLPAASFDFNVLPGDATRDGRVTVMDEMDVRNRLGRSTAAPGAGSHGYTPFADLDGNGRVDAFDFANARARLMTALPSATVPFSAQRVVATAGLLTRLREDDVLG